MEYPKIQTIYKRLFTERDIATGEVRFLDKGKSGNPLIRGDYSEPEFANIRNWNVEEKIDGMNVRIFLKKTKSGDISIRAGGRTDKAQMPPDLDAYLRATFERDRLASAFEGDEVEAILFGEGFGPRIQSGGYYSKEPGFVLFDVLVGKWWLTRDGVAEIADRLDVPTPPQIGVLTEPEILQLVQSKPLSKFAKIEPHMMEGVICRSEPLTLFRNGKALMWKLKCRDFI